MKHNRTEIDESASGGHAEELFFNFSFDLLAVVSADGYFKRVNPAFQRVMGYTPEELYSQPIASRLHPDDVERTKTNIQRLAGGTPTVASRNRYLCKDGQYRWFSWNTTPRGQLFYTIGRDITEEINAEEKIRELHRQLEVKNADLGAQVQQLQKMDAIGRLAGGMAHDFNNILGAISLYCDLLRDRADDPVAVREKVADLMDATQRAAALTKQLLVFSRKQVVQLEVVNLNPLINQLQKMLARLIGENIKIVTRQADDLRSVRVDPSQMEQVILNLVVNARDAMPNGGKITIETSNVYLDENFSSRHLSVDPGHYVLLVISDTGVGMDNETVTRIFEPFFTTKPVGKGTGLGLTTTYGIVKQSRGTIWVYSEVGRGTTFKIYLPISDATETAPVVESLKISAPEEGNQTILLVEDDEYLREGFLEMLSAKGYRVLAATDGDDAIQVSERHAGPIDLLLTDMIMPGLSGVELARKISDVRANIRVLYMSGYTSDTLENADAGDLETMDFIQKPFGMSALIAKVQDVLLRK